MVSVVSPSAMRAAIPTPCRVDPARGSPPRAGISGSGTCSTIRRTTDRPLYPFRRLQRGPLCQPQCRVPGGGDAATGTRLIRDGDLPAPGAPGWTGWRDRGRRCAASTCAWLMDARGDPRRPLPRGMARTSPAPRCTAACTRSPMPPAAASRCRARVPDIAPVQPEDHPVRRDHRGSPDGRRALKCVPGVSALGAAQRLQ